MLLNSEFGSFKAFASIPNAHEQIVSDVKPEVILFISIVLFKFESRSSSRFYRNKQQNKLKAL